MPNLGGYMMSVEARVQVSIEELRGIGAVPISVTGVSRYYFLNVPREVVQVNSLQGGIAGTVTCTILSETDRHFLVQIPQAHHQTERLLVPKEIVVRAESHSINLIPFR